MTLQYSTNEIPSAPVGRPGWPWTIQADAGDSTDCAASDWPKITIVTPSFNQGAFIEETIRSVLLQDYPNLEYIIIDGGSNDNTADVIRKYERFLTYWVSEKDRGQSHAINKGLMRATGEIFNWLNSDDYLQPGALHTVARTWRAHPNHLIAGSLTMLYENGEQKTFASNGLSVERFVDWRLAQTQGLSYFQPVTFMPTATVKAVGGVREELRLVMDHFLMIDLLQRQAATIIEPSLAVFRLHDQSKTRAAAHCGFMVETARTLCEMGESLPVKIDRKTLRQHYAETLVAMAKFRGMMGEFSESTRAMAQAMQVDPIHAMRLAAQQKPIRGLARTLGQKLGWIAPPKK